MATNMSSRVKRRKRLWLLKRQGYRCAYCSCALTLDSATLDHYIPLSRGGVNHWKNLRACCVRCNYAKKDSLPPGVEAPSRQELIEKRMLSPESDFFPESPGVTFQGAPLSARMIDEALARKCEGGSWR